MNIAIAITITMMTTIDIATITMMTTTTMDDYDVPLVFQCVYYFLCERSQLYQNLGTHIHKQKPNNYMGTARLQGNLRFIWM